MSKLIVVVGVTGTQGGSVAGTFLNNPGYKVRGITRSVSSTKATTLASRGVEIVEGDLDDKSSLIAAFKGAHVVFGTTDFWGPVFNPATRSVVPEGKTINEYVFEYEKQQAMNIAEAAAATEGLERFITSALCNATKWTKGRLTHVYHFDSKALTVEHIKNNMPDLAAKMSVLQIGSYMSNLGQGMFPKKQADGTYRLTMVGSGNTPIPHFATATDTGACVLALLQVSPGKNLLAAGDMLSWKQFLQIWCKTQNVPYGGYDEVSVQDFAKNAPVGYDLGLEFAEMFALMDAPGYDGGDPTVVMPKDLGVPCPTTTWEEYCRENDYSQILKQQF